LRQDLLWSASRDLSLQLWRIGFLQNSESLENENKNPTISEGGGKGPAHVQCSSRKTVISNAHTLNIAAVAASNDGTRSFSGSRDYSVKVWSAETAQCINEFKTPRNVVTALEVDISGGPLLYQGSEDLCVRIWDTRESSKQPCVHITGFVYFPLCMSINDDSTILATGCKGFDSVGCEVKLWDLRMQTKLLQEFKGHSQDVTGIQFGAGSLFSVSKDGSIFSWNYKNNKPIMDKQQQEQQQQQQQEQKTPCLHSVKSTGKMFTSLTLVDPPMFSNTNFHLNNSEGPTKFNDSSPLIAAGAFDGSINFFCSKTLEQFPDNFPPFFTSDTNTYSG